MLSLSSGLFQKALGRFFFIFVKMCLCEGTFTGTFHELVIILEKNKKKFRVDLRESCKIPEKCHLLIFVFYIRFNFPYKWSRTISSLLQFFCLFFHQFLNAWFWSRNESHLHKMSAVTASITAKQAQIIPAMTPALNSSLLRRISGGVLSQLRATNCVPGML